MGPSAAVPHGTAVVLQEKQLITQLEKQLQAETEKIEVVWRSEGVGAARPQAGDLEEGCSGHGRSRFCLPGAASGKTAPARGAGGAGAGECLVSGTGPCSPRLHPGVSAAPGAAMGLQCCQAWGSGSVRHVA